MFSPADIYAEHLRNPQGHGYKPEGSHTAAAGSVECGNTVFFHVLVENDVVKDCGFDEDGCQTLKVVGSMVVEAMLGENIMEAAKVSVADLNDELGGLTPQKFAALELVVDAAHVALGRAVYHNGQLASENSRYLVAMSGGVDSSVVALMLSEKAAETDFPVTGVTVELWRDTDNAEEKSCCSISAVRNARAQAHKLGFPHFTLDLREQFREGVVQPFVEGYANGVTPNPCVACNGNVRIDAMIDMADRLGAAKLATGHYANIVEMNGRSFLTAAADPRKDQTYMLAALSPESVARLMFPLGSISKDETRDIAARYNLFSAKTPDSQDLCFLAGTTHQKFMEKHGNIVSRPGNFVRRDGSVVGQHKGTHNFTVGQRKGIGIGGGETFYVLEIRPKLNEVVIGTREELVSSSVVLRAVKLYEPSANVSHVRLRYHSQALSCKLDDAGEGKHSRLTASLLEPADTVSPGQSACLLDGDRIVGVATIGAM